MPTRTAALSSSSELVSVGELLSTCVDAALKGCGEIRAVQERRSASGSLASTRKVEDDPRSALTEADTAAQIAIVDALRAAWPGLRIVGEEEEHDEDGTNFMNAGADASPLRRDLCDAPDASEWKEPMDALVVFVDPVDGTREFVEGRLSAVQCLIGVACRGRAVAGAVGLPFPDGGLHSETSIVWGVARPGRTSGEGGVAGARRAPPPRLGGEANGAGSLPIGATCVTGDSKNSSLAAARLVADCARNETMGGAGNKILAVADGRAEIALMHFGTSLWDTCAPEAVLRSRGGKVTDLFGAPLAHDPERPGGGLINDLGVLATAPGLSEVDARGRDHAAIAASMRADETLVKLLAKYSGASETNLSDFSPQASDVARCLDGSPLRVGDVSRAITSTLCGGDERGTLLTYSAPESTAIRGLMSDGVRLELAWGDSAGLPSTAFYKRVKLGDLEYARVKAATQPMKIARDVTSAGVEARFLASSEVTSALAKANVRVPRCFHAALRPCAEDPIESAFALVLEDFAPKQGWHQEKLLNPSQARATLSALARMHATFTSAASRARGDDGALQVELENAVWPAGAYWQPGMQPKSQMTTLAATWRETHVPAFREASEHALPSEVSFETLGDRLQEVAADVGAVSHPFGLESPTGAETSGPFEKWRTLIHGDAKAANVFLRQAPETPEGVEIGLIDFQWMGFGLGAVDAAHVIAASVDPQTLGFADGDVSGSSLRDGTAKADAASELFKHYYDEFIDASVANGAAGSLEDARATWPLEEAAGQYDAAILDFSRVVFGYQWVRVGASPASLEAAADSYNKNSYNKSLPNAMWLVCECDAALRRRQAAAK
jgi:3'-phosphoadenosine 5'-phosphosulfate (PAPS) 3'-phosphatase